MKGLMMLLSSMGVKIDPAQIEDAFNKSKDALPRLAAAMDRLAARQDEILQRVKVIEKHLHLTIEIKGLDRDKQEDVTCGTVS